MPGAAGGVRFARAIQLNMSRVPRPLWPCFTVPHGHNGRGTRDELHGSALGEEQGHNLDLCGPRELIPGLPDGIYHGAGEQRAEKRQR